MIFTVTFLAFLVSFTQAATSYDETPYVTASQMGLGNGEYDTLIPKMQGPIPKPFIYVMAPTGGRRNNREIQGDRPFGGYFYPKPSQGLNLPAFKTLDANAPQRAAFVEETEQIERQPRSPQRMRRPNFPSPPPFMPGFIPPNRIRPLPALYINPMRLH